MIRIRRLLDRQQLIILTNGVSILKYPASIEYYLFCCYVSLKELKLSHRLCEPKKIFSKHRPSGPMLSISRNVHMCVCLFVCLSVCSLFEVPFKCLFAPTCRSRMSNFFWNPWGKVMERIGLRFEHFSLEVV